MGKPSAPRAGRSATAGREYARWVAEAARLLAEGQASDIDHASRKAAARLGIARNLPPPAAAEVAAALAAHQRLFGGARHLTRLDAARRAACEALRVLAPFAPIAVGGIVDGSAASHADITLVAYSDDELVVMHHLAERGIPTSSAEASLHGHGARAVRHPALRFRAGEHGFTVAVLPVGARGHALLDRHGNPLDARADLPALTALLSAP